MDLLIFGQALFFIVPSLIDAEDGISPCSTPSSSSWERCSFTEGKSVQRVSEMVTSLIAACTPRYKGLDCNCYIQSKPPPDPNVKHDLIDTVGALLASAGIRDDNLMWSVDKHCLDLFKKTTECGDWRWGAKSLSPAARQLLGYMSSNITNAAHWGCLCAHS